MKTEIIEHLNNSGWKQVIQSEVLSNGEFKYRLYVTILDYDKCSDAKGFGVDVEIAKVVKSLSKKQKEAIRNTTGTDLISDVDVLDYGYRAILDGHKEMIKTKAKALKIADEFVEKLELYKTMLGFYLDKAQNRIGNTGWDFLNGNIG